MQYIHNLDERLPEDDKKLLMKVMRNPVVIRVTTGLTFVQIKNTGSCPFLKKVVLPLTFI